MRRPGFGLILCVCLFSAGLFLSLSLHADVESAEGSADLSSESAPVVTPTRGRWDKRNLTEERAKVRDFVDGLLGPADRTPPHVKELSADERAQK